MLIRATKKEMYFWCWGSNSQLDQQPRAPIIKLEPAYGWLNSLYN